MATSFFRTAFQRVVAARERQASRYVNGVLMNLDDQTLKGMGTSREELRRKGGSLLRKPRNACFLLELSSQARGSDQDLLIVQGGTSRCRLFLVPSLGLEELLCSLRNAAAQQNQWLRCRRWIVTQPLRQIVRTWCRRTPL